MRKLFKLSLEDYSMQQKKFTSITSRVKQALHKFLITDKENMWQQNFSADSSFERTSPKPMRSFILISRALFDDNCSPLNVWKQFWIRSMFPDTDTFYTNIKHFKKVERAYVPHAWQNKIIICSDYYRHSGSKCPFPSKQRKDITMAEYDFKIKIEVRKCFII